MFNLFLILCSRVTGARSFSPEPNRPPVNPPIHLVNQPIHPGEYEEVEQLKRLSQLKSAVSVTHRHAEHLANLNSAGMTTHFNEVDNEGKRETLNHALAKLDALDWIGSTPEERHAALRRQDAWERAAEVRHYVENKHLIDFFKRDLEHSHARNIAKKVARLGEMQPDYRPTRAKLLQAIDGMINHNWNHVDESRREATPEAILENPEMHEFSMRLNEDPAREPSLSAQELKRALETEKEIIDHAESLNWEAPKAMRTREHLQHLMRFVPQHFRYPMEDDINSALQAELDRTPDADWWKKEVSEAGKASRQASRKAAVAYEKARAEEERRLALREGGDAYENDERRDSDDVPHNRQNALEGNGSDAYENDERRDSADVPHNRQNALEGNDSDAYENYERRNGVGGPYNRQNAFEGDVSGEFN